MGNCITGISSDNTSLLRENEGWIGNSIQHPPRQERTPVYYPASNDVRPAIQLSEEKQMKIARRIGLLEHLPILAYSDAMNNKRECVICMVEFRKNEDVRFLPCMHVYHVPCINDWLMRSFTCPSCMEPVDAALLTSYNTN